MGVTILSFRVRRVSSLKPTLMTPLELLDQQISELEGRVDNLNAELTGAIKTGAELASSIEKLEQMGSNRELIERRKRQLDDTMVQRSHLMKKLKSVESQIARKKKEKGT